MADPEEANKNVMAGKSNGQTKEARRLAKAEERLIGAPPRWLEGLKATVCRRPDDCSCGDDNIMINYKTIEELCRQVKWCFGWVDSDFLAEFMDDSDYAIRRIYLEISMSDPLLKDFYRRTGGWDMHKRIFFEPTPAGLQACYYVLCAERIRQQMQKDLAIMVVSEELGEAVDGHTNRHELPALSSFKNIKEMDAAIQKAQVDEA